MPTQKDYERNTYRRQQNQCPVHETKLVTTYYDDLDLLVSKCRDEQCIEGHGMIENFKMKKDKKRQAWEKKNARKVVQDEVKQIESENMETTRS
ncbi:MAG: hypothetical protein ACXABY_08990 [Candidatus Thorarchaeota archaeon]